MRSFIAKHGDKLLSSVLIAAFITSLVALVLMLGCSQPVTITPKRMVVKNSLWQTVPTSSIIGSRSIARDVTGEDLQAVIDDYNKNTIDDFLRAYAEDAVPPVDQSPTVDVFFVNPNDYSKFKNAPGIERQELIDNYAAWMADANRYGAIVYIDHIPPAPVVPPVLSQFAYWAIYGIDETGHIVYEDHCGYRADEQFYQADIGDYASPEIYYPLRVYQINHEVQAHAGWTLKADHTIYTEPTP